MKRNPLRRLKSLKELGSEAYWDNFNEAKKTCRERRLAEKARLLVLREQFAKQRIIINKKVV